MAASLWSRFSVLKLPSAGRYAPYRPAAETGSDRRRRTAALGGLVGTACVYSSAGWMLMILGKVQCRAKRGRNKYSSGTQGELPNVSYTHFEASVSFVTESCCHPSFLTVQCGASRASRR